MRPYDALEEQRHYNAATWGIRNDYQNEVLRDLLAVIPDDASRILDVGCGDGFITNGLRRDGRTVIGLDLSPTAAGTVDVPYVIGDVLRLPFSDASFDLVMANDVVEHFSDWNRPAVLQEIARVSARYIVITVPFTEQLSARLGFKDGVPVHRNRHYRSFSFGTVQALMPAVKLAGCVFSGVTWEDEMLPVEQFKAARMAAKEVPYLRDGAPDFEAELRARRVHQGRFLSSHPRLIDSLRRRTEIISLFVKPGFQWPFDQSRLAAVSYDQAVAGGENKDLMVLDPATFQASLATDLPLSALWPYCVPGRVGTAEETGLRLTGELNVRLKFGFFAPIQNDAIFRLQAELPERATLALLVYDADKGYRQAGAIETNAGSVHWDVPLTSLKASEFGFLFELKADCATILINSIHILQDEACCRAVAPAECGYLERSVADTKLLIRADYEARRALPIWFGDAETQTAWHSESIGSSAAEAMALADTFRLQGGEIGSFQGSARDGETRPSKTQAATLRRYVSRSLSGVRADMVEIRSVLERRLADLEQTHSAMAAAEARTQSDVRQARLDLTTLENLVTASEAVRAAEHGAVRKDLSAVAAAEARTQSDVSQTRTDLTTLENLMTASEAVREAEYGAVRKDLEDVALGLAGNRANLNVVRRELMELGASVERLSTGSWSVWLSKFNGLIAKRDLHISDRASLPVHGDEPVAAVSGATQTAGLLHNGLPRRVTMLVADDRIDRRVLLQARSLARLGVAVAVVAAPYPGEIDYDSAEFPEVQIYRIDTSRAARNTLDLKKTRLHDLRFGLKDLYFYADHFTLAAWEHAADIYVAHDLPVLGSAIAAADLHGSRIFYDAHELYPEQIHFGEDRMAFYRTAEKSMIRHAAMVTTINQSIADEMVKRYEIDTPHILFNTPDVDPSKVPLARTSLLRQALGIDVNKRIVLFQGSLSLNRNLEPLAEAMAYVVTSDVVLVIMGPGDSKRAELQTIASQHGLLGSLVYFHAAVSQTELLAYTASADIGIIPYPAIDFNTLHCTPNKLFEFMTAGLPIVANDLPELRRFVVGQHVGITHPMTDARSIANAIDRICAADLNEFRASLNAVAPRMTWRAQEKRYLALLGYQELPHGGKKEI